MNHYRPAVQRCTTALAKIALASASALFLASTANAVEPLPTQVYLPLTLAQTAANVALKKCTDGGYRISVAVTDRAGVITVLLRGNGAGVHTVDSSARKAYTAASMGRSTLELANFIKDKPELHGLRDMNEKILLLGGGLPIKMGDELVGGIGVGGTPSAVADDACAQEGLDAILEKSK